MDLLKFVPVRGRKLFRGGLPPFPRRVGIYPREGTETPVQAESCCRGWLKFIPVRGRKLAPQALRFTHLRLKFIPVRGRKHPAHAADLINSHRVEIYPREGTETSFLLHVLPASKVEI